MKHILLFAAVLLSAAVFAQTQSPMVGTWKLVSGQLTRNDSTQNYTAANLSSLKIISPTHFAVFGENSDGSFSHAFGGSVTITPDTYTESIDFGSSPDMKGRKAVFKYEVKGDQLHINGGMDGITFNEMWTRVKQ
jgi:hypothetical protein